MTEGVRLRVEELRVTRPDGANYQIEATYTVHLDNEVFDGPVARGATLVGSPDIQERLALLMEAIELEVNANAGLAPAVRPVDAVPQDQEL